MGLGHTKMLNLVFKHINILVRWNNFCTLKVIHFDLSWFSSIALSPLRVDFQYS